MKEKEARAKFRQVRVVGGVVFVLVLVVMVNRVLMIESIYRLKWQQLMKSASSSRSR